MSDREAIQARRARLIALALAGTTSVTGTACVCLSPPPDYYDAGPPEDAPIDGLAEDVGDDADE